MKTAVVKITGVSPYQQSRFHGTEKLEKESNDDYEKRTWANKAHYSPDGNVFIPPMALKKCLEDTAKYLSMQIPGRGKSTYTKHFLSGILITEPAYIGCNVKDVSGCWVFGDAMGQRGGKSGKRVIKCFPTFPKWEATVEISVLDETITKDVLKEHLEQAGKFIGIGTFRPHNGGYYGRFTSEIVSWK
jgi:hypothetical protein